MAMDETLSSTSSVRELSQHHQGNFSVTKNNLSMDEEALNHMLRRQVEFYFSKSNLQSDGFLVSKMDSNGCVPISVIASFAKVRALSADEETIAKALKDSSVCTVTPQGIRPNLQMERNTIILREIPSSISPSLVQELFDGDNMKPIKSIRSDVGDTWFVTCNSEADAMATILALRNKKFDGKYVKARLKGENLLRSFYPVQSGAEIRGTPSYAPQVPHHSRVNIPLGSPYTSLGMGMNVNQGNIIATQLPQFSYNFEGTGMYNCRPQHIPMIPFNPGIQFIPPPPPPLPPQQMQMHQPRNVQVHMHNVNQMQRQPMPLVRRYQKDSGSNSVLRKEDWQRINGGFKGSKNSERFMYRGKDNKMYDKNRQSEGYKVRGGKRTPSSGGLSPSESVESFRPDLMNPANFPPLSGILDTSILTQRMHDMQLKEYPSSYPKYRPDEILHTVGNMNANPLTDSCGRLNYMEDTVVIGNELSTPQRQFSNDTNLEKRVHEEASFSIKEEVHYGPDMALPGLKARLQSKEKGMDISEIHINSQINGSNPIIKETLPVQFIALHEHSSKVISHDEYKKDVDSNISPFSSGCGDTNHHVSETVISPIISHFSPIAMPTVSQQATPSSVASSLDATSSIKAQQIGAYAAALMKTPSVIPIKVPSVKPSSSGPLPKKNASSTPIKVKEIDKNEKVDRYFPRGEAKTQPNSASSDRSNRNQWKTERTEMADVAIVAPSPRPPRGWEKPSISVNAQPFVEPYINEIDRSDQTMKKSCKENAVKTTLQSKEYNKVLSLPSHGNTSKHDIESSGEELSSVSPWNGRRSFLEALRAPATNSSEIPNSSQNRSCPNNEELKAEQAFT